MSNFVHRAAVVLGGLSAVLPAAHVVNDPRIGLPMAVVGILAATLASVDKVLGGSKAP
jgi:hypothetical protein